MMKTKFSLKVNNKDILLLNAIYIYIYLYDEKSSLYCM